MGLHAYAMCTQLMYNSVEAGKHVLRKLLHVEAWSSRYEGFDVCMSGLWWTVWECRWNLQEDDYTETTGWMKSQGGGGYLVLTSRLLMKLRSKVLGCNSLPGNQSECWEFSQGVVMYSHIWNQLGMDGWMDGWISFTTTAPQWDNPYCIFHNLMDGTHSWQCGFINEFNILIAQLVILMQFFQ